MDGVFHCLTNGADLELESSKVRKVKFKSVITATPRKKRISHRPLPGLGVPQGVVDSHWQTICLPKKCKIFELVSRSRGRVLLIEIQFTCSCILYTASIFFYWRLPQKNSTVRCNRRQRQKNVARRRGTEREKARYESGVVVYLRLITRNKGGRERERIHGAGSDPESIQLFSLSSRAPSSVMQRGAAAWKCRTRLKKNWRGKRTVYTTPRRDVVVVFGLKSFYCTLGMYDFLGAFIVKSYV